MLPEATSRSLVPGMLCPGPNWQQRAPATFSGREPERKQSKLGAIVTVKLTKRALLRKACKVAVKKPSTEFD